MKYVLNFRKQLIEDDKNLVLKRKTISLPDFQTFLPNLSNPSHYRSYKSVLSTGCYRYGL